MNIEFPDYAYNPTETEYTGDYYYQKMLEESYKKKYGKSYATYMISYFISKQYNDDYFEDIATCGDDEVLEKLKKIMDRNDIYLD